MNGWNGHRVCHGEMGEGMVSLLSHHHLGEDAFFNKMYTVGAMLVLDISPWG